MVEDVHNYIISNDIKRPYICGYCIGSRIAMRFASKYPELTKGLVLIEPSIGSLEMPSFEKFMRVLKNCLDLT
jgi:pimeloyl-ACP methyl ester carboxylesterase